MKRRFVILLLLTLICFPFSVLAHGDAIHVMGTVTETAEDHLIVKTPKGQTVSVMLHPDTTYRHNGIAGKDARPQVGDRLIAEAAKKGEKLIAKEIRFSTPKSK